MRTGTATCPARCRAPGVRRVLNLGDSFAWGASVEFEDAYPQRLERALNRRRREPWEVVNLALPGMASVDHAAQLEKEGDAYAPDVVVLGYVLNDSQDAAAAEAQRAEDWVKNPPPAPGRSALVGPSRARGCGPRPRTGGAWTASFPCTKTAPPDGRPRGAR